MSNEERNGFGRALRAYRQSKKAHIGEFVEKLGWSKSYLMDLEMGRSAPPKKEKIKTICDLLGVPDKYTELLALATTYSSRVALQVDDKKRPLAALLARDWGDLTDEKIQKLQRILEEDGQHNGNNND